MIKLDVISHGDLTSQPWEEQWDTIHGIAEAVREGVIDPDSRVEGKLRVSVASKSEVKRVNERFGSMNVEVDEGVQQFEDREVCRVLAEKVGGNTLLTPTKYHAITSVSSWFANNDDVEVIDFHDINLSSIAGDSFSNCPKLKVLSVRANSSSGNICANCPSLRRFTFAGVTSGLSANNFITTGNGLVINMPDLQSQSFNSGTFERANAVAIFLPSLQMDSNNAGGNGGEWWPSSSKIVDLGAGYKKFCSRPYGNFVIRATSVPTKANFTGATVACLFVPSSSVSSYKSDFSTIFGGGIFAIGGTEWRTAMRTLADQYASEYAGWSASQIASADYSDPYIDYRIFGLEPPTE